MDNGRTLGFQGDTSTKYAEVVFGGDSMTLVVRISGRRQSMIEAPMLIFINPNSSYPIQGLDDNILGVSYRTRLKGWMDHLDVCRFFSRTSSFSARSP